MNLDRLGPDILPGEGGQFGVVMPDGKIRICDDPSPLELEQIKKILPTVVATLLAHLFIRLIQE
jgi:hypothetical protein